MAEDTQVGWANTGPDGALEPLHRRPGDQPPEVDLRAENERLRALVQAFEEDHARLVATGDHLRVLLNSRRGRKAHKVPIPLRVVEQHAEDEWLAARNPLTAPDPPPDPVEGDSGQAEGESGASEVPR